MIIKGYIFSFLYGVLCLALGLVCYKLGMPKKYSRKTVHILIGFEWVILYHYIGASYHFLIVCLAFLLLLGVVYFKKLMPMISSESDNAPGTVYYAVAMSVMALITLFEPRMLLPFGIGVFCTSFGDGFAGVLGQLIKKCNPKVYKNKTLFGMLANFIFSTATALIFSKIFDMGLNIWQSIAIGAVSVGLEVITGYGLDNISTTLGTSFLSYAFMYIDTVNFYIVPIILTPFIIMIVTERKVLSKSGLLCAIILDVAVSLTLGNVGFILLLAFLVISVIIDKIKKRKNDDSSITKRGECRDHVQVLANGLIPMVMAVMFSLTVNKAFLIGYVAALAEALADTAASGMGAYSKTTFDIFKMRKCKKGISGGMSVVGTVASLFGAAIISALALLFGAVNLKLFFAVIASAFLGAVFDSFLGSVLQVKYKCTVCGELTEREEHCKKRTEKVSGIAFFDNDIVNLLSGAFSAVLGIVFYIVIY